MDSHIVGTTQLLAGAIGSVTDSFGEGVGVDAFETLERGVAATVHAPSGDRYRVSVEWLGDRESDEEAAGDDR